MLKIKDNVDLKEILEKFNKEVEKAELTRNPYSNEDKKFKHILVSLSEEHFNIFKDTLEYITNLQEYKKVVQREFKREYAKRYLEERRKEQPNLLYPDSDEIYKRYYELKEEINKLTSESTEWEERTYCWQDRAENLEIIIDRAIEYNKKNIKSQTLNNILQGEDKDE